MNDHRLFQKNNRIINFHVPLFLSVIVVSLQYLACVGENPSIYSLPNYQYQIPEQTDDGWETASPASVGIDGRYLTYLMSELESTQDHRIHSILIIKDGKLVFEEYFPGDKFNLARFTGETGFDRDDTHNLCSVTKSFTSALIGIAIDKGYIQSTEKKVYQFFNEYADIFSKSSEKKAISLKHLLTMTSGIEWDDETYPYMDSRNDMNRLFSSNDPIRYILSKDLIEIPGDFFAYRNCNTNVLGEIIHKATGKRLDEFSDEYLFSKLGISDFEWQRLPKNIIFCSGDLRLRPRDMAKFGYLFLNQGKWKNQQIISQEWVNISTQKHIDPNEYTTSFSWADGYGYQWWIWEDIYGVEFNAYFASGWGGQWIIMCPEMNTVIVSTAGNYYTEMKIPIENILTQYIIPAIE